MSVITEHLDRYSPAGIFARHPTCSLPPNDVDFYATATAGNTIVAGAAFPNRVAAAVGPGGLPTNANVQVAGGATFTAAKTLVLLFEGRNENWERVSESLVCTGTGAATQNFSTQTLWSQITAITVVSITGTLVVGETFAIGIGDGAAAPAAGTLVIMNPLPGAGVGQISFIPQNAAPTAAVSPTRVMLGGRGLEMRTGYTAINNLRIAAVQLANIDAGSIESPATPVG